MVGEHAPGIEIKELVWDDTPGGNIQHITEHGVTPTDVQTVLDNAPLFFLNLPGRAATHVMIGEDARGRVLYVPLLDRGGALWQPVTAFENRSVRRIWQQGKSR